VTLYGILSECLPPFRLLRRARALPGSHAGHRARWPNTPTVHRSDMTDDMVLSSSGRHPKHFGNKAFRGARALT